MKIIIAPSLLAADFTRLADEIRRAEEAGADWLHLDIMDGHFVRNITIGPPVVERIRKTTRLPLDCHLMIEKPERHTQSFLDAGADSLTFHVEAFAHDYARKERPEGFSVQMTCKKLLDLERVKGAFERVRAAGKRIGIAVNPETDPESAQDLFECLSQVNMILMMTVWPGFGGQKFISSVVPKIRRARKLFPDLDIQVDGGIDPDTAQQASEAGANVLVAGTSTFRAASMKAAVATLRERAEASHVGR